MYEVAGDPVSVHDVAGEIRARLPGVPTKKLHKLCYYCQGHHLGTFGVPLFVESIAAWDMGPVVSQLWHREKRGKDAPSARDLTEAQLNTVGYVLSRYGALTGKDLETLSHNQAPWRQANERRRPGESAKIEQAWIEEHFARDVEEDEVPLDTTAVREWLAGARERRNKPAQPDDLGALRARLASASG
jgi:uncharacterized phage-associated protein